MISEPNMRFPRFIPSADFFALFSLFFSLASFIFTK